MGQLCTLGHQNLIMFLGYVETPNGIVMKRYLCSFRDVLKDKDTYPSLSKEQICEWTQQIATGMQEVHRFNVVHLDLKPLNVLMDKQADGRLVAVVSDFGCANVVGNSKFNSRIVRGLEAPSTAAFTVVYAAPEVRVCLIRYLK